MAKKYKFKIGNWVSFRKHYTVHSSDDKRYSQEIGRHKPIIGQICGAVIRHLGKIETEEYDYHNLGAYLVPNKSLILYQIRDGMINVPYEVKEEDIKKVDQLDLFNIGIFDLPWKNAHISEPFKKAAAKQAESMPRNSKGQFTKERRI